MNYSLDIDGYTYKPIPERWITHRHAYDRDARGGPRLYAISVAEWNSKTLRLRYAHPALDGIGEHVVSAIEPAWADRPVPEGLVTGSGWGRTLRPGVSKANGRIRGPEEDHLAALWAGEASVDLATNVRADGGAAILPTHHCRRCGRPVRAVCGGVAECVHCDFRQEVRE